MDNKDVKLIDAARLQFDAVSEKARILVYRKVLEHYQKHPGSPWSGAPLRDLEVTIQQFYADLGVQYDKVFRDTLPPLMQKYYDRAVEEMRTAGVRNAILGKPDSRRVKYFLDSAFEQVAMKTQNMSFQHIKALRSLTADVTRQMSVTGATRREVSKVLLERAMDIPGFEFIDKAGTKWPLKSYFNTLARTELMTAARASYDDKVTDEGFDVMKLTTSGNCCEKCARFEGRLFSLTGATPGLPTKQNLIDAGVFHPNCTHSYSLVPDFIRERDYDEKGIRKKHEPDDSGKSGGNRGITPTSTLQPKTAVNFIVDGGDEGQYAAVPEYKEYVASVESTETMALEEQYTKLLFERTTNGERSAIRTYTGPEFQDINAFARRTVIVSQYLDRDYLEVTCKKISSALDKVRCQSNIKVFRAIKTFSEMFPDVKIEASTSTIEDIVRQIVRQTQRQVRTASGFTSCSIGRGVAKNYGGIVGIQIEINVPAGARGAYIRGISQNQSDFEFLLDKDTKYVVTGMRIDESGTPYMVIDIMKDM